MFEITGMRDPSDFGNALDPRGRKFGVFMGGVFMGRPMPTLFPNTMLLYKEQERNALFAVAPRSSIDFNGRSHFLDLRVENARATYVLTSGFHKFGTDKTEYWMAALSQVALIPSEMEGLI